MESMQQTFTREIMSRQQMHRRVLPDRQTESHRLRPLQLTFVNSTSALPRRPEPRAVFDNAARRDNPSRPWERVAEPLRAVARDAARIGGACAEETGERIIDFGIALIEYMLEPLGQQDGECGYLIVSKEVPEAVEAITDAKLNPTPENIARADREACEAAVALQLHRGGLRKSRSYMRPLGATPPMGVA